MLFMWNNCGYREEAEKPHGSQHPGHEELSSSSEPSPPRKRPAKNEEASKGDDSVVEIMNMIIDEEVKINIGEETPDKENNDNIMKAEALTLQDQAKQIQDLEAIVATLIK